MQRSASLLVLTALALPSPAQTLVKDLNSTPDLSVRDSNPGNYIELGGKVVFTAEDLSTGREFWETDGTTAGTRLFKDLNPGIASSRPSFFVELGNGEVLFTADVNPHGWELHKSDGTAAGTKLVLDIYPGPENSGAYGITATGGVAYFMANDGIHGQELWKSDGTAAGTSLVADLTPGGGGSSNGTTYLLATGGLVYFSARTNNEWHLWVSDGTAVGTVQVTPSFGPASSSPIRRMVAFQGGIAFYGDDPVRGEELWLSDGTFVGTGPISGATPGAAGYGPTSIVTDGTLIYYRAFASVVGYELWVTDGTLAGTSMVIDTGPNGGLYTHGMPYPIGFVGSDLLFTSSIGAQGRRLFRTDGTTANTVQISDVQTYNVGTQYNGELYFSGFINDGYELWKSDGTSAGTSQVVDINPGPDSSGPYGMSVFGGLIYFAADNGPDGNELWTSDGTASGTQMLAELADESVNLGSSPAVLGGFQDKAYFSVDDGSGVGAELWWSDGTAAGTFLFKDINPGPASSAPNTFIGTGDFFFFGARDDVNGAEPWVSDGTPAGTRLLKDIRPGIQSGGTWPAARFGNRVVFVTNDATIGNEPWITDGTTAGTVPLADINPTGASSARGFYEWKGLLYFAATDGSGQELFVTDGTTAGTRKVLEIGPGAASAQLGQLVGHGDHVYFSADDGVFGSELWRTDGTAAGTMRITDIAPGAASAFPSAIAETAGGLVFYADTGGGAKNLWRTDGVNPAQFVAAVPGNATTALYSLGDLAVFMVNDGTTEGLLWVTDGTAPGTGLLKTIEAFGNVYQLEEFWRAGESSMFFRGNDGVSGSELWVTDGTASGTRLVADIGLTDGFPFNVVRVGSELFLSADDGVVGRELHALPLSQGDEWAQATYGAGCPGTGGEVPEISISGSAQASASGPLAIKVENGLASSPALLLWGPSQGAFTLAGGCRLYVAPPLFIETTSTDGTGAASFSFAMSPSVIGYEAHFQWAVIDPQGAFGNLASLSAGLEIVGGP